MCDINRSAAPWENDVNRKFSSTPENRLSTGGVALHYCLALVEIKNRQKRSCTCVAIKYRLVSLSPEPVARHILRSSFTRSQTRRHGCCCHCRSERRLSGRSSITAWCQAHPLRFDSPHRSREIGIRRLCCNPVRSYLIICFLLILMTLPALMCKMTRRS